MRGAMAALLNTAGSRKGDQGTQLAGARDRQSEHGWELLRQESNRMLMLREGDKIEKLTAIRAAADINKLRIVITTIAESRFSVHTPQNNSSDHPGTI